MYAYHRFSDAQIKALLKNMIILTDTREQQNAHILEGLDALGVKHRPLALPIGDYACALDAQPENGLMEDTAFGIIVERKGSLDELAGNFTSGRERFADEMHRGKNGRKILLIEGATGFSDILQHRYQSGLSPKAFYSSLMSFMARFGLVPIFCAKEDSAKIIAGLFHHHIRAWLQGVRAV